MQHEATIAMRNNFDGGSERSALKKGLPEGAGKHAQWYRAWGI